MCVLFRLLLICASRSHSNTIFFGAILVDSSLFRVCAVCKCRKEPKYFPKIESDKKMRDTFDRCALYSDIICVDDFIFSLFVTNASDSILYSFSIHFLIISHFHSIQTHTRKLVTYFADAYVYILVSALSIG